MILTKKQKQKQAKTLKEWRKNNPEKRKAQELRSRNKPENKRRRKNTELKKLYGITIEQYERIVLEQNNKCAICNKENIKLNHPTHIKQASLVVDHNHETGFIRGLLCYTCNLAVGNLKDNLINAKSLVSYLEKEQNKLQEYIFNNIFA